MKTIRLISLVLLLFVFSMFFLSALPDDFLAIFPLPYRALIERESAKRGLDPNLVAALIRTESNFRSRAVSSQGAIGLMQILPSTGAWIAVQLCTPDYSTEMLYDPEINITFGTWYLRQLIQQFDDVQVALAAYNAGRGNVAGWLSSGSWDGSDISAIPFAETRRYVEKILDRSAFYASIYGDESPVAAILARRAWARLYR